MHTYTLLRNCKECGRLIKFSEYSFHYEDCNYCDLCNREGAKQQEDKLWDYKNQYWWRNRAQRK